MGLIDTAASEIWVTAFLQQASDPATIATRWQLYAKSGGFYQKDLAGAVLRLLTSADLSGLGGTYQPLDADLTALAAISSAGLLAHTGAGTAAARTLTGTANRIGVTNGDGAAGNPTLDIGSDVVTLTGTQVLTNKKFGSLTTDGVVQVSGGDGTPSTYKPTLFVQTADVTIANTTTATSIIGTGVGSMTLPANTLTAGKAITFQWKGLVSSAAAPGNVRNNLKLNGAATITSANVAIGASLVTRLYTIDITIVCRSVGASGVIDIKGRAVLNTSNTALGGREILLTATTTIDTTATIAIDVAWVWDTADAANTVTFSEGLLKQEAA